MKLWDRFLNLVFPPKCVSCGELLDFDKTDALCAHCRAKYETEKGFLCPECGEVHADCSCMPKLLARNVEDALHLVEYMKDDSVARDMILYAKDLHFEYLYRFLTSEVKALIEARGVLSEDCLFTYVPRSAKKRVEHGVDQAREVAKRLAKAFCRECYCLLGHTDADEQKSLTKDARKTNTAKSYFLIEKRKDLIKGKHIILYDDVITTGATLAACSQLLKKAGAREITIVTLAKSYLSDNKEKNPVLKGHSYGRYEH